MRVLLIAYYFPPIHSIGSIRNWQIWQQATLHGHDVVVLTTSNRRHVANTEYDAQAVQAAIPLRTFDYRRLQPKGEMHQSTPNRPAFSPLSRFLNSFPVNILIGEGGLLYILHGYRKAVRMHRKTPFQVVQSGFRPMSDHVIGWLLKKRFPALRWVADFRDPFLVQDRVYGFRLQAWFQRVLLRRADVVTVVSDGVGQHLRSFHANVVVVRNAAIPIHPTPEIEALTVSIVDPKPKHTGVGVSVLNPKPFTITYTGSVYTGKYRVDTLIEAIASIITTYSIPPQQLQLVYCGKDSATFRYWVEGAGFTTEAVTPLVSAYFIDKGQLPWKEARRCQAESDVNVLLTWSQEGDRGILTGKLYEYLAARRPVLALVNGDKDAELETIFSETQVGNVCYTREELASQLYLWFLRWQKGETDQLLPEEPIKLYYWETSFRALYKTWIA